MKYVKSCGCIVIDKNRVLLVSSRDDKGIIFWGFPKGHQEKEETNLETAIRETKEEVGLDIEITDEVAIRVGHLIKNKTVLKEIIFYLSRPIGKKIQQQEDEIEEVKWVLFSDVGRYLKNYYLDAWHEAINRLNR